jgi:hypothetical protein
MDSPRIYVILVTMILRTSSPSFSSDSVPQPAFEIFLRSQKDVPNPLPVLQSAHCHLAGELAAKLVPDAFGPLPDAVIEAVRLHDYGWIRSDMRQLESRAESLCSFLTIAPAESTTIWSESIRLAESVSPLAGALVSRHFCTIADSLGGQEHLTFLDRETVQRLKLEENLAEHDVTDLERWTAALGFCDLLSLYLCSGAAEPAELALCHPFDSMACARASKVVVHSDRTRWRTEPHLFPIGTRVEQYVMGWPSGTGYQARNLNWRFE